MPNTVRVRYAPSPTGQPHLGNIRTALFNWLLARRYDGQFIVRVEDTDRMRLTEGATEAILEALRWLGMDWDEGPEVGGPYGPYLQSQCLERYQAEARRLLDSGHAYYCYCSEVRLEELRKVQMARKLPPGYDRRCRSLSPSEREKARGEMEAKGRKPVIRFKVPLSGESTVDDLVRGRVAWQNELQDDFVIIKSDGFPTYHLAVVVDDHYMKVSHVMRAEEWLPSTPKHLLLHEALGYQRPLYAHLPMILGKDRSKLSKRHGATSVLEYRAHGYLPDAMLNFLALLGWSLDDRMQIISRDELIRSFSIERIGKAGAIFDQEKLDWMNGVYMRQLSPQAFVEAVRPFLDGPPDAAEMERLLPIAPLLQERLMRLDKARELMQFFFAPTVSYEPSLLVQKGMDAASTSNALRAALEVMRALPSFDVATLEGALRPLSEHLGVKTGQLFGAIRVAVTGQTAAPPLFETMVVVGREVCIERITQAIRKLG
jgi:glutamyl-tRNA synthetase